MKKSLIIIIAIAIILLILGVLFIGNKEQDLQGTGKMQISSVFQNNGNIPSKYTADGENINPPLTIEGIPEGTQSLVLIVDDPDAPVGTWDHWILINISPTIKKIEENSVPENSVQLTNSWGNQNYGGPSPPSGTHRYFFKLFALDTTLDLTSDKTKSDVEAAMQNHVLDKAELIGLYSR